MKFLTDINLLKLTKYLRFWGYDILSVRSISFNNKIRLSNKDKRIILTKSKSEFKNKINFRRFFIPNEKPIEQFLRVVTEFNLNDLNTGKRCLNCNSLLKNKEKGQIKDFVPSEVYETFQTFKACYHCGKIFWEGSHFKALKNTLSKKNENL